MARKKMGKMLAIVLALLLGSVLVGCDDDCPAGGTCVARLNTATGVWEEEGCGCLQGQHAANARCTC